MLFNSLLYALFLPAAVAAYYLAPARARVAVLLVSSYLFYAAWDVRFLPLIIGLTLLNYWLGFRIQAAMQQTGGRPKLVLGVGIALNLATLGFFKYTLFVLFNAERVLELAGLRVQLPEPTIILPLAISFFTFEFVHYLVDISRGHAPVRSLLSFALFPAFFPTQIAGPIKRYQDFVPQLQQPAAFRWENLREGLTLIVIGLFKKALLADNLARISGTGFAHAGAGIAQLDAVLTVLAFTFQIYFDFSGYTDIGRGSARLMGFSVPENFNRPYMATNISDFWRRWHITLSSWLRDYLYIPLGGNRRRQTLNLLVTMVLGGLWHGASTTFLVWGAVHGVVLAAYWKAVRVAPFLSSAGRLAPLKGLVGWFFTFCVVCLAWVFFRAETTKDALFMVLSVLGVRPGPGLFFGSQQLFVALVAGGTLGIEWWQERRARQVAVAPDAGDGGPAPLWRPVAMGAALAALYVVTVIFSPSDAPKFVYFQF